MLRWDERSNPIFTGKEHPRKCFFLFIPGVCPVLSLSLCSQTPPPPQYPGRKHPMGLHTGTEPSLVTSLL